ncbi:hypothetical protein IWQ54_002486 [Labrenzia sp. EL_195]|nr:hypothetical protein [Labrenzia sp. EL_195]
MAKPGYFASRCKARHRRTAENSWNAAIARKVRLWAACPLKKAGGGLPSGKGDLTGMTAALEPFWTRLLSFPWPHAAKNRPTSSG